MGRFSHREGRYVPPITRPSRLAFFLRRLAATGNIRLAAADSELARSGLHKRRVRDPAFAASWQEALNTPRSFTTAGLGLDGGESETPCREAVQCIPGAAVSLTASSHLTAPGDLVILPGHGKRRAQVRRSPGHRLTPAGISAFLAMLERTANIRLAARHVGVAASSIHRRRLDGAFADAIDKALNLATMDIEADLLFQMNDALSPQAIEAAAPALSLVERPHSIEQAIWLLKVHRDHVCRRPRQPWSALGVEAETRIWDSIRRKITAIKQARGKGQG